MNHHDHAPDTHRSAPPALRTLTPTEEVAYLKEIHGEDYSKLFTVVIAHFDVLQTRSQMLVSLVAICLTITGFSGPRIAASGFWARTLLSFGLSFVLFSALILLVGPLQLRWGTHHRATTLDQSLVALIRRRNIRTIKYMVASAVLILGLGGYMGSLLMFLMGVE